MDRKKILLFGKNGQLGSCLNRQLGSDNLVSYDYPEIDFRHPEKIGELIEQIHPGLIINAAAHTAVDKAESEADIALAINGDTVEVIAEMAKNIGAGLIHFSTDYVFDGESSEPYKETDRSNPINVYGRTKLAGEENILSIGGAFLIFRLSWVYSVHFPSFVTKLLEWSRIQEILRVVDDQISRPTWASMVAEKTIAIMNGFGSTDFYSAIEPVKGVYHLANDGEASRYDWALEILRNDPEKEHQLTKEVQPVDSSVFPTAARRPLYTVLDCSKIQKTFNLTLPDWKESLSKAMGEGDLNE